MTASPAVPLPPDHYARAADTLARAFYAEPTCAYLFPDPDDRLSSLRLLWSAAIRYSLRYGEVLATPEVEGVACWIRPGCWQTTPWRMLRTGMALPRAFLRLTPGGMRRALALDHEVETLHRQIMPQPHWYLWLLGTLPARQGQGIATRVLRPILTRAAAEGLPCYLEAWTEPNIAFYQNRGFAVVREETVARGHLTVRVMVRWP